MDPLWVAIAFALGFAAKLVNLPPMVGYLAAGFVLSAMGVESSDTLERVAELGVLLLLFSIGLKLKIKTLLRTEIWAGASLHMLITVVVFGLIIYLLAVAGLSKFSELSFNTSLLVAFALSFSSTVFAVKVLEDKGEISSLHGNIAIGVLIIQDILAVIFLTFSSGKMPSPWALSLVVLFFLPNLLKRSPLSVLIDRVGHGELLVLLGILLPIAGAELFNLVELKPDLGALVIGMILAQHKKADELSKAMFNFKDLFLVGFFLTVGLSGVPNLQLVEVALLLIIGLPFKVALFYYLFTRFKLRARTATLSSFSLANFSEFGLIIGYTSVASGWLGKEWLVIFAIALSITFVLASVLNAMSHVVYGKWHHWLQKFEMTERLPDDKLIDAGNAEILILGMGRLGTGIYSVLRQHYGDIVLGIDYDEDLVLKHEEEQRRVVRGDATDFDFWDRVCPSNKIRMIILAMSDHASNLEAATELRSSHYHGKLTGLAQYADQIKELQELGADAVYDFYSEAGAGFAEHICNFIEPQTQNVSA